MAIATGDQILAADVNAVAMLPESRLDISDDFITGSLTTGTVGALSWQFVGISATQYPSFANHPGIFGISTTAVPNNRAYLFHGATNKDLLRAADLWEKTFIIYAPLVTAVKFFFGAIDDISAATTNQHKAGFEFNSATDAFWMMCTGSGAAETRTATNIAPVLMTFYKLKIKRIAGGFEFYIDDVLKGTVTLTLPANALTFGIQTETLDAASKEIRVDFFHLKLPGITR